MNISVIIPTFNRPEFLKRALESALNQDYDDYEIIVVNDAGCSVKNIIDDLKSDKIRYIDSKKNLGLPGARNLGIKNAKGKYICFLDDDDILYPNHLSLLMQAMLKEEEEENCAGVYSDSNQVFINQKREILYKKIQLSIDWQPELFAYSNYIHVLNYLLKRNVLEELNCFDEKFRFALEDYDLLIRLSEKYYLKHIQITTAEYTRHIGGSFLNENFNIQAMREYLLKKNHFFFEKYKNKYSEIRIDFFKKVFERKFEIYKNEILDKKIFLYGTGEAAKIITNILEKNIYHISGYIQTIVEDKNKEFNNKPIISCQDFLADEKLKNETYVFLCVSDLKSIFEIFEIFKENNYSSFLIAL
ncbi:MAG TPA: glycosyltransferase [bacterium]|nr:glycosyltransferase [bacterium]